MQVRLIAVSKPMIPECETPGDLIAYCARVSNPANQANRQTAPRLLRYLRDNRHWSPFEVCHMTLEITTTRDVARQILRHRSFTFQEHSFRYAEADSEPEYREARMQDHKNRQNSLETDDSVLQGRWLAHQAAVADVTSEAYEWALENGIAKEVARAVLPEGLTKSRLYMAGSVRSWIHYVELRKDASTQKEHRKVAEACAEILYGQFPEIAPAEFG